MNPVIFLIRIAFGGLSVTIEQRTTEPTSPARTIPGEGEDATNPVAVGPGLAKTKPALRVVRRSEVA